jgi:hypothetical protein
MKLEEKTKAQNLRRSGYSIKDISKKLLVSKASVSVWVRNIKLTNSQKLILNRRGSNLNIVEKRRTTRLKNEQNKREVIITQAGHGIESINKNDLKIIGTMLYWAEGRKRGKRTVGFSNSDPEMIKIIMRFFREICEVKNKKFRGHIHTFSHLNVEKSEKYWSKITKIPKKQFYKTYSKPSISSKQKMNTIPYGTIDIMVNDVRVFLEIMGWIKKISMLVLKK